jgi:myo-inositol 2-dehydrogenase/D-chiro-inositol 1-dehydrogenase
VAKTKRRFSSNVSRIRGRLRGLARELTARTADSKMPRMAAAPIPVGLVGAGKHGARYLRHLAELPELSLRLLCRRDAVAGAEQARGLGARFVADFRELATSPDVAAVIVVVPPSLNPEICALAAAAGKAVLVEKPLAVGVADCTAIRQVVQRARVPFMVAHTLRFDTVVAAVRAELPRLGPIHQVCLSQRFEPSRLDWLDDRRAAGGGNILHTGVHSFDLLRLFTGEDPQSALALTRRVVTRDTEDDFAALFSFDGPLLASVAGSRATAGRSGAIEISAERGQIVADHVHSFAFRIEARERIALPVAPRAPTVRDTLRAFARMLRDGTPPPITLEDGTWAVAMAEACYRSAESGRAENITI